MYKRQSLSSSDSKSLSSSDGLLSSSDGLLSSSVGLLSSFDGLLSSSVGLLSSSDGLLSSSDGSSSTFFQTAVKITTLSSSSRSLLNGVDRSNALSVPSFTHLTNL